MSDPTDVQSRIARPVTVIRWRDMREDKPRPGSWILVAFLGGFVICSYPIHPSCDAEVVRWWAYLEDVDLPFEQED